MDNLHAIRESLSSSSMRDQVDLAYVLLCEVITHLNATVVQHWHSLGATRTRQLLRCSHALHNISGDTRDPFREW